MRKNYESHKDWYSYFYSKPRYFKTVNVRLEREEPPFIVRDDRPYVREKVRPLALTNVTHEVAGGIVSWKTGVVGIIPPPTDMFQALLFLKDKGAELYKENTESLGGPVQAPAWIQNCRSLEDWIKKLANYQLD